MGGHVKVARHAIYQEAAFEAAAEAAFQFDLFRVLEEAHFVTARVVLNVQTDGCDELEKEEKVRVCTSEHLAVCSFCCTTLPSQESLGSVMFILTGIRSSAEPPSRFCTNSSLCLLHNKAIKKLDTLAAC